MGFGLLTALNVDDVPKILHRVAQGYRATETNQNLIVWLMIAEEIDKFANELAGKIEREKNSRRIRL